MPADRYPGYDVLARRRTPSWNEVTRRVIDRRLAISREPRALDAALFAILEAVCDRIIPQPTDRPPVPIAIYIDAKLADQQRDGFRHAAMPEQDEAWRRALRGLETAAQQEHQTGFAKLPGPQRDALLQAMQDGALTGAAMGDMASDLFFSQRLLPDITAAYYAHPTSWSEIGFGGPASPRGYVRLGLDRRDAWEATEAIGGDLEAARRENRHVV